MKCFKLSTLALLAVLVGCESNSYSSRDETTNSSLQSSSLSSIQSSSSLSSQSSSSSSSQWDPGSVAFPSESNTLALLGPDADQFNGALQISHFNFMRSKEIYYLLSGTQNAASSEVVSSELPDVDITSVSFDDLTLRSEKFNFLQGEENLPEVKIIINVLPIGMNLTVWRDTQVWRYYMFCGITEGGMLFGCDHMYSINEEERSITFDGIELAGSDAGGSISTGPLYIKGTLTWQPGDELNSNRPQQGTSATLEDLDGVWDFSTDTNEHYLVVGEGRFVEYDYDDDADGSGGNCYYVDEGAIESVSDGEFLITNSSEQQRTEFFNIQDDNLITLSSVGTASNSTEGDFVPECD